MTFKKYKFAVFSALVLSMIIPFAGINIAHASQTTADPFHIGKVADGTYNETSALQRIKQIVITFNDLSSQKTSLGKQLITKVQVQKPSDIQTNKTITDSINMLQSQMVSLANEYDQIQQENKKLYYIDPVVYQKYVSTKDAFVNSIQENYWQGKSFDDSKNAFPLVAASINHKKKAIEIVLSKDTENSPKKDQYIGIIDKLIPKDIPWFISYDNYPTPVACSDRNSPCTPIMGGINIGFDNKFSCTMSFEAIRSGVTGFVTAGHCAAPPAGNLVHQPFPSGPIVGTKVIELYSGRSTVNCDCAFASTNGGIQITDQIFYSSTYQPRLLSTTPMSQQSGSIVQSGLASGVKTGSVTNTNVSVQIMNGPLVTGLVQDSMQADCGDSGSPVTNGLFSLSLFGIVESTNNGGNCGVPGTVTYHVPSDAIINILGANPVLN